MGNIVRYLTLIICLLFPLKSYSAPIPVAESLSGRCTVSPTQYFEDKNASLHYVDITASKTIQWQEAATESLSLGLNDSAWWFKFIIDNNESAPLYLFLTFSYANLDEVTVFFNGKATRLGDHVPFSSREIKYRYPTFKLKPPPGQSTVYIKIQSTGAIIYNPRLDNPESLTRHMAWEYPFLWIYYGLLLFVIIHYFFLYLTSQNYIHLFFVLFIVSWSLFQMSINGYAFQYLWPNNTWWANNVIPVTMCTTLMFGGLFFRSYFLSFSEKINGDLLLISLGIVAPLIWSFVSLTGYYAVNLKVACIIVLLSIMVIFTICVQFLPKAESSERYIISGFILMTIGVGLYLLKTAGVIQDTFLTNCGIQIGSAVMIIVFSLGLIKHINIIQNKLTVLNQELETRVHTRTKQLESAMENLANANAALHDLSTIDGLTGVKNRRFFDKKIIEEWKRALRNAHYITLLMIDIDHFKAFNDTYGHLVGDECLKLVAGTIRAALRRAPDSVARYGGEEFIVILENTPAEGALHVAEAIRSDIEGIRLIANTTSVSVTVSIGCASVCPPKSFAGKTDDAIKNLIADADQCLYQAKQKGRNRIVAQSAVASKSNVYDFKKK